MSTEAPTVSPDPASASGAPQLGRGEPTPMKPSEALRSARQILTPQGAWIKGAGAQDSSGKEVSALSIRATCFCAYGAIWRAMHSDISNIVRETEDRLRSVLPKTESGYNLYIDDWNDDSDRTHAEVLAAFDRAAEIAEQEGR